MRRGQKQKIALWSIKMDGELRAKSTRKSPNSREKCSNIDTSSTIPKSWLGVKCFTRTVFEMVLERKIGISLPSQVLNNCFNPCIWKRENICMVSNFQVFKTKAVIFNFPCGLASPQWVNAKKHFCQLYLPLKKIR